MFRLNSTAPILAPGLIHWRCFAQRQIRAAISALVAVACSVTPAVDQILSGLVLVNVLNVGRAEAAENLRLREGLSFVHDVDKGFPIIADKFDDVKMEPGKATLLFFGAAGDLNTNRQARRLVELYKKLKNAQMKFIIVDVDHVSTPETKVLIKSYYQGYIPQDVILDKQGKTFWTHIGEIDQSALQSQLEKVLN